MNHVYLYRIMIFRRKKIGVRKNTFFTCRVYNSLKSPKIVKLNIDTLIIPQGLFIHEKNQS